MTEIDIESVLAERIDMSDIMTIAAWASENQRNRARLWHLAHSDDRRTSVNALWAMTHLPPSESAWLQSVSDEQVDMLLAESDTAKKRMLLQLLREQEYTADDVRTDLLDFCLSKINSECEPYAIRAFSIYTAFKICRHYPELISELEEHLLMMSFQALSPGLISARRKTLADIKKLRKP